MLSSARHSPPGDNGIRLSGQNGHIPDQMSSSSSACSSPGFQRTKTASNHFMTSCEASTCHECKKWSVGRNDSLTHSITPKTRETNLRFVCLSQKKRCTYKHPFQHRRKVESCIICGSVMRPRRLPYPPSKGEMGGTGADLQGHQCRSHHVPTDGRRDALTDGFRWRRPAGTHVCSDSRIFSLTSTSHIKIFPPRFGYTRTSLGPIFVRH